MKIQAINTTNYTSNYVRNNKQNYTTNINFKGKNLIAKENVGYKLKNAMLAFLASMGIIRFKHKKESGTESQNGKIIEFDMQVDLSQLGEVELHNITEKLQEDNQTLIELYKQQDDLGKNFAHKASSSIKLNIMNNGLRNQPEVLEEIYLTKDIEGRLPAHGFSVYYLREMNRIFKDKPELLKQIYTTKDNYGNLPAHDFSYRGLEEMNNALANQKEVLAEIYSAKNQNNELIAHNFKDSDYEYDSAMLDLTMYALKDQPDVLVDILLTPDSKGQLPAHQFEEIYICEKVLEFLDSIGNPNNVIKQIYQTKDGLGNTPEIHIKDQKYLEILYKALHS